MKIRIRNETATIEGYVNAVERFSKVLYDTRGKFIEKIMPNAFAKALEKNSDVLALLNHDYDRVIARTGYGTATLYEDNIGLHAKIEVSDKELIEKAKEGKLQGWSFGFRSIKEDRNKNKDGLEERTIRELEIFEVSVLDDKKNPAYYGTSIEMRDDETFVIEYREGVEEKTNIIMDNKLTDKKEKKSNLYKYANRLNEIKLKTIKSTAE